MPLPSRLLRHAAAALLAGCAAAAFAQPDPAAALTPKEIVDALGIEVRQLLATPRPDRTAADAQRDAAQRIAEFAARAPGHLQLTAVDTYGRTPLMSAVGGGYLPVVQALLADPAVRLQINEPDKNGVTAWMEANFAPGVTLVACQPGTLTVERAPLIVPYVRRMSDLLGQDGATLGAIVQALENAGADPRPDDARRAWLERCPNAEPELRQALAEGPLMGTLLMHAIRKQAAFNRQFMEARRTVAERPPEDMVFIPHASRPERMAELLKVNARLCPVMRRPELNLGRLMWQGEVAFKVIAATRAGGVEAVDVNLTRQAPRAPASLLEHLRAVIIRALAGYECRGDQVFEQEFMFKLS